MKIQSIRNILVPIDFSKMSIQTIETAKSFARRFGAIVHLAHVRQFFYPAGFTAPMPPVVHYSTYTYDKNAEKKAARDLVLLAKKHGLSASTTHLLTGGSAFDEVCRLAKELPADLIVMPTHGRTGFKHVFLGSTAERIVQHSPCPVLVLRKASRPSGNGTGAPVSTIVVPIDFSDCSIRGLKYAIEFAQKIAGKIILIHVVAYRYASNGWVTYELTEVTKAAEKEAARQMQKIVDAAKFGDVPYDSVILNGDAVEQISGYARSHDVDIVITSTHGLTGFKHVLIGSTAERLVRHAPCSVLVVPSHPEVRAAQFSHRSKRTSQPHFATQERSGIPLTRKNRKIALHAFPERRNTNKFRESHLVK